MTTITELPNWFLRTSAGKKLQNEANSELTPRRQKLTAEQERLNTDVSARLPELRQIEDAATEERKVALDNFKSADADLRTAAGTVYGALQQHSSRIADIDHELRLSADLRIEQARKRLIVESETISKTGLHVWEEETGKFFRYSGLKEIVKKSNRVDVLKVLDGIGAAINALEGLKLANSDNVEATIAAIVKGLPSSDTFAS